MPKMIGNRAASGAGQTVLVHVRCNATGKVKRENRDGRETIIVPSFAAKANTVLNEILYPEDELRNSFKGLNRTPAPLGHPLINGKFVPALDPEALARNHVFAWNENARWVGDRIALDVVIDEARAKESEGGKKVLNAIEQGEPISTSTGLFCNLDKAEGDDHKSVARNIEWDHVAILLDEEPAISTDDGVGIFVNSSKGEEEQIEVINSALEDAERELDWAADMAVRAAERMARVPVLERIKTAIMEAVLGSERETSHNAQENDMAVTDEQFNALSDEVKTLSENLKGLGDTITNAVTDAVKPLKDHVDQLAANQKAEEDAKRTAAVNTLTKGGQWTEADLEGMTLTALNKLVEKSKPGTAAALNSAFPCADDGKDDWAGFDLNANFDDGKKKDA